jgi:hypothetical protein
MQQQASQALAFTVPLGAGFLCAPKAKHVFRVSIRQNNMQRTPL